MSQYTCHSDNVGTAPRVTEHTALAHTEDGVSKKLIRTHWLPIQCGHITSELDLHCAECTLREHNHV